MDNYVKGDVDHPMSMGDEPASTSNGYSRQTSRETTDFDSTTDSAVNDDDLTLLVGSSLKQVVRRGLLPTGCCYDDRMKLHVNADWSPHPHHPEDPRRIEEIFNTFKKNGLIYTGPPERLPEILRDNPTRYMWRIPAREARQDEILLAHQPAHYAFVKSLTSKSYAELRRLTKEMDQGRTSLYVGSMSYYAALLSAGGAIETLKHVVEGRLRNAFAVIRPPGHHAEKDEPMGFCFFNNVPVAVRLCQMDYPETCRKVMILDWDVHHGNGIQNIFYEDPNVLYVSLHVYENGTFYPGKPKDGVPDGGLSNCGRGPGIGRNVNIGWHSQGMGDGEYMAAFQRIIMPIAREFNPDLVVISAGFDAADGDELGGCFVTPACYAHMTHMLMSLAEGKVAVCLEGGYNLKAISISALSVARTLMGEPPPRIEIPRINKEASRVLAKVQSYQAQYWDCMRPGIVNIRDDVSKLNASRLHDVVRNHQRQDLQQKHQMVPLYIHRENMSHVFESQVLVTPRLSDAKRLLFIIHDPPQLLAQPDVDDSIIESHNAWVVDELAQYIDWAIENGFGVMDINIPGYIAKDDEQQEAFMPRVAERVLESEMNDLVCYIWDNYLQLYDQCDEIFLMGVGNAYLGIRTLLTGRVDCKERISGVVNFVTGTLKAVKSDVDEGLSAWYKENSRIYVGADHACWNDEMLKRKVTKRRFGTVIESKMNGLNHMLHEHAKEAQEWIMERVEVAGETTEDDNILQD
ncbi:Histone deacetylase clr3 [Ceratocystis fimbriata CBS 114723]|uniref:Histone deacetylase n=1 Tax=Ceratocystis fimbriata CBS 114723 TaxID=1035309 RepID=A0A2C5X1K1_9PEZI|nr:Histone deacetylase clr3 [Ceratocystis fimbriata CBS 114723]